MFGTFKYTQSLHFKVLDIFSTKHFSIDNPNPIPISTVNYLANNFSGHLDVSESKFVQVVFELINFAVC